MVAHRHTHVRTHVSPQLHKVPLIWGLELSFSVRPAPKIQKPAHTHNRTAPHTSDLLQSQFPVLHCLLLFLCCSYSVLRKSKTLSVAQTVQMNTLLYLYLSKNSDLWPCRSLYKYWRNSYLKKKKKLQHLILSIGQINRYCDSLFQLLCAHDLGEPGGAQVLIIDITEGMGIKVES